LRANNDAGKIFATYSEDLPFVGFDGATSGYMPEKHNRLPIGPDRMANQVSVDCSLPFSEFPDNFSLLPDVSFVIPKFVQTIGHDLCAPFF